MGLLRVELVSFERVGELLVKSIIKVADFDFSCSGNCGINVFLTCHRSFTMGKPSYHCSFAWKASLVKPNIYENMKWIKSIAQVLEFEEWLELF
jgi:hypothetical protein